MNKYIKLVYIYIYCVKDSNPSEFGGRDSRDGIRDSADAFSGHTGKLSKPSEFGGAGFEGRDSGFCGPHAIHFPSEIWVNGGSSPPEVHGQTPWVGQNCQHDRLHMHC